MIAHLATRRVSPLLAMLVDHGALGASGASAPARFAGSSLLLKIYSPSLSLPLFNTVVAAATTAKAGGSYHNGLITTDRTQRRPSRGVAFASIERTAATVHPTDATAGNRNTSYT